MLEVLLSPWSIMACVAGCMLAKEFNAWLARRAQGRVNTPEQEEASFKKQAEAQQQGTKR